MWSTATVPLLVAVKVTCPLSLSQDGLREMVEAGVAMLRPVRGASIGTQLFSSAVQQICPPISMPVCGGRADISQVSAQPLARVGCPASGLLATVPPILSRY